MLVLPRPPKGNLILSVTFDTWFLFKEIFPSYDTDYYNDVVEKTLKCANPQFGFRQYMCLSCGKDSKVVAFSCKSKFCTRCGRVNGEKFSHSIKDRLHPDVIYRHLVLTIPAQLRQIFYINRQTGELFNNFFAAGWACVQDFVSKAFGHKVECGCLTVLHLVGRNGEYKPHLHVLLMGGGINTKSGVWEVLDKFPYRILHQSWKKVLLEMFREWDVLDEYTDLFSLLDEKYPKGFVARIEAGNLPKASNHLVRYISKYLCRPQISQKRIKRYDSSCGEVEFEYKSHRSGKIEKEKLSALNFLGRLLQQILPKGFQRIRYYGLQASKNSNRLKYFVAKAVGGLYLPDNPPKEEKTCAESSAEPETKELTYQDLVKLWWGSDPFKCQFCGARMELVRIWKPVRGFVFSIFRKYWGEDIGPPGNLPDIIF